MAKVRDALSASRDFDEILSRLAAAFEELFEPSSLTVILWIDGLNERRSFVAGEWRTEDLDGSERPRRGSPVPALEGRLAESPHAPWWTSAASRDDPLDQAAKAEALDLGAAVALPVLLCGRLAGIVCLGPKRSGASYRGGDREMLSNVAWHVASAVQVALLFRQVASLNRALEERGKHRPAEGWSAYCDLPDTRSQLLQQEKMASLGQLMAGVAHEINSPLTAVIGNVAPLWRELERVHAWARLHGEAGLLDAIERMRAILEVVTQGARRTAGIVGDLRSYSRSDIGEPTSVDLNEGIEMSLRLLRTRWEGRLRIHKRLEALPPIDGHPGQLNQVFVNLIANACDAIAETGNLWIHTRSDGDQVRVILRDDGCGIDEEDRARIFEAFFTTKALGQGTGLGLTISESIIRAHGGTLDVESASGRGTTFTVTLPTVRPRHERQAESA